MRAGIKSRETEVDGHVITNSEEYINVHCIKRCKLTVDGAYWFSAPHPPHTETIQAAQPAPL